MRKYVSLIFNYYLVIKNCWFIIFFMLIGYFALISFDQGLDILKTLGFVEKGVVFRQTFFVLIAVIWWSWQTFRASRVLLHFSYFNFWNYQPAYSLRAQVLVPRALATIPFFLLAFGVFKAHRSLTPFVLLLLSSGLWMFVFLHFRKAIIVWIKAKKIIFHSFVPDYIPIKNGTYPAHFIWDKQNKWIKFRLVIVFMFFTSLYFFPVSLPQYLGSAAIVLFAFGTWLIIAALISMIEKFIKFPISFSILVCLVMFSFFNNNHHIRYSPEEISTRPTVREHFKHWAQSRIINASDSLDVYLVMAEGGGIRSAYWTSGVLNRLFESDPDIRKNTYAFSGVSGGALGSVISSSLINVSNGERKKATSKVLKKDFLAPVTASLTFNDMMQRFIPWPVKKFDRMRVLESSWEQAWDVARPKGIDLSWSDGFVETFSKPTYPLILLNSAHVESGMRTVVSNADLSEISDQAGLKDLFNILGHDVPISTAIGLSSRFPFLTPPALVQVEGKTWGSLVDGGYYENLGARTMMDTYSLLKSIVAENQYPIRFNFIAIRNTKATSSEHPVRGMFEIISPLITFSHIWANTGNEALFDAQRTILRDGNRLFEIHLIRDDKENIPLGWYLSENARSNIDKQLNTLNNKPLQSH